MPRSLPALPCLRPLKDPAASDRLGPLELAHRLALAEASPATQADRSPLLVVDVRSRRQFARGHLPGSQPIPAGLLVSGEWPEGDLLLVDGGNGEAERVREALHNAGYGRRILVLAGGFAAWQAAGLPVASSRPSRSWSRWLGSGGGTAPALPDLQDLLANPDLRDLLGNDAPLPDLAALHRA